MTLRPLPAPRSLSVRPITALLCAAALLAPGCGGDPAPPRAPTPDTGGAGGARPGSGGAGGGGGAGGSAVDAIVGPADAAPTDGAPVDVARAEVAATSDAPAGDAPADVPARADLASEPVGEAAPPAPGAHDCRKYLGTGAASDWARPNGASGLSYKTLGPGGDRMMDFSHAGYRGGGVALPRVPAAAMLTPSGGDDTMAIQAAIDAVAARPLADGFRGAVELAVGTFRIEGVVRLGASGVVLRGSGKGAGGTEIMMTGAPRRAFFIEGTGARMMAGTAARIVDAYVPAGARTFTVDQPELFAAGDAVVVGRPVTEAWIALVGMDKLMRNGAAQTWITPGSVLRAERVVTAVAGNVITIDVPIPDSFDAKYVQPPGGSVAKYTFPGRIANVGIENLRVVGSPRAASNDFHFVRITAAEDVWIRDVVAHDVTSGVVITDTVRRVTVEDMLVSHTPVEYFTAAAPSDFNIDGAQVLIHRSGSQGGNKIFYHSTAGGVVGPNVILKFTGSGMRSHLQPHMRWATGLLTDSTTLDDGNIEYINRGTAGSGHGWAMGWGVVWNSKASSIKVFQPAGAANWAIGNQGTQTGDGTFDAHGTPVAPSSLYLAQLCVRLGPAAVAAIGY